MNRKNRTVLALGILTVIITMGLASVPLNTFACGDPSIDPPTVVKCVAPSEVSFGSVTEKSTVTIKVTVHLDSAVTSGTNIFKMIVPNGIFDSTTFSVD